MTVTVAEFKTLFPGFASYDDSIAQFNLDCIVETTDKDIFKECYKQAIYLQLAHELTMDSRGSGSAGSIVSEKVGNLSRTYGAANSANSSSYYESTAFGKRYLRLVSIYASGPTVIC